MGNRLVTNRHRSIACAIRKIYFHFSVTEGFTETAQNIGINVVRNDVYSVYTPVLFV